MKGESYGEKSYISDMKMQDARVNFSLRSRMYDCKMNFLNKPVFKAEMWRFDSCRSCVDSQSHILYCPSYQQLQEGKSLSSDQAIVSYFKEVLAIRLKLNLKKWNLSNIGLVWLQWQVSCGAQLWSKICRDENYSICSKFALDDSLFSVSCFIWTKCFCLYLLQK